MFTKRFCFATKQWEVLKKNKDFKAYFDVIEEGNVTSFIMPYSFVMGIFNYLSSVMHAGALLYIKHILHKLQSNFRDDDKWNVYT